MWTSSLNSALNLLLLSYLVLKTKNPHLDGKALATKFPEFNGFVEGDDGIAEAADIDGSLVAGLGIKLKLERHPNYTSASFCGIVKPIPRLDVIVTDPKKVITDFFWLSGQDYARKPAYHMGLIRAKALSLYYQYRNVPCIGPLCFAALKRTRSFQPVFSDDFWSERIRVEVAKAGKFYHVPPFEGLSEVDVSEIRLSVETLYKLEPEWQLRYEDQIRRWGEGLPHVIPAHECLEQFARNFDESVFAEAQVPNHDLRWRSSLMPDPRPLWSGKGHVRFGKKSKKPSPEELRNPAWSDEIPPILPP